MPEVLRLDVPVGGGKTPFNSLFEMQRLPLRLREKFEELAFNSLFEMRLRPLLVISATLLVIFQFSI